ncbi:MAG: hypothetical protein JXR58_04800 [Bacteroidales bacterium]|nr:hypothetical protein [Bacteroidales bacterium]
MKIYSFYILVLLLLSSCTVRKIIQFDVLRPAETTIPGNVKEILLAVNKQEISAFYLLNKTDTTWKLNLYYKDLIIDTVYKSLIHNSEEIGKFKVRGIIYYDGIMDGQKARNFADANRVDGLLIMENFNFYYSQYEIRTEENPAITYMQDYIGYSVKLAVYDNLRLKIMEQVLVKDDWNEVGSKKTFKNYETELAKVAEYCGGSSIEKYLERISPHWETVSREIIIAPNTGFKTSLNHFKNHKPDSVVIEMEKYYNCNSGKIRRYALYNTAIAYEMMDNPEESDKIMDIIMLEKNRKIYKEYSNILFYRIIERKRLENQIQ